VIIPDLKKKMADSTKSGIAAQEPSVPDGHRKTSNHFRKIEVFEEIFYEYLMKDSGRTSFTFMEIGAQYGLHARHLLTVLGPAVKTFTLNDISDDILEKGKPRLAAFSDRTRYAAAEIEKLDSGEKYDGIFINASLHHFQDPVTALRTIKGLLAPGGIFILCEPMVWNPANLYRALFVKEEMNQLTKTRREQVREYLNGAGFMIIEDRVLHTRFEAGSRLSNLLPAEELEKIKQLDPLAMNYLFAVTPTPEKPRLPSCSVIIAALNEAENLKKCLDSMRIVDYPGDLVEMIVVDNGSTDDSAKIVRTEFPEVSLLTEKRPGASFARNAGIRAAKKDIVVFLDADTAVTKDWLKALMSPFSNPKVGAVGGQIRPMDKTIIAEYLSISLFSRYHRYGERRVIKGFPSCNLAMRRTLAGDGFDTERFTTYAEDKDICYKIIGSGHNIVFEPGAVIYHKSACSLKALFSLWIKSSPGRVDFAKKHKFSPDSALFDIHVPLLVLLSLVLSLFFMTPGLFALITGSAVLFFFWWGCPAYRYTGNFFLSFIAKPFLDIVSVYVIYFSYHYFKLKKP
jgi:GT2 family glycosyltransferase/ubiquinone/menaquinone biosynthesis C-methylase UbiE